MKLNSQVVNWGFRLAFLTIGISPALGMEHPLDPLKESEIKNAMAILKKQGKIGENTLFPYLMLKEPPKAAVHAGTGWSSLSREAAVVLFDNATNSCHEAELNLTAGTVTALGELADVHFTATVDAGDLFDFDFFLSV